MHRRNHPNHRQRRKDHTEYHLPHRPPLKEPEIDDTDNDKKNIDPENNRRDADKIRRKESDRAFFSPQQIKSQAKDSIRNANRQSRHKRLYKRKCRRIIHIIPDLARMIIFHTQTPANVMPQPFIIPIFTPPQSGNSTRSFAICKCASATALNTLLKSVVTGRSRPSSRFSTASTFTSPYTLPPATWLPRMKLQEARP